MDEPPSDILIAPFATGFPAIALCLLLSFFACITAAAFAAARTALYFAGLAGREDIVWAGAGEVARSKASRWMDESRLLTVVIQVCHTFVRVITIVGLVAAALILDGGGIFVRVVMPAVVGLVLSEAFARLFARKYPVKTLALLNRLITLVYRTMMPVARALDRANNRWRAMVGQSRSAEMALAQVMELAAAAAEQEEETDVVKGIVNFSALRVRDLMKHRSEICALSTALSFEEVMDFVNRHAYSRIPVFKESIDHIVGVLYIKDLLPFFGKGNDFPWASVIRPGYFVWANKKIDALLKDFQEKRVHVAIVRDDAGNTAGLITLEDLIEVVIRDINEQRDSVGQRGYSRIDDRTFVFNAKTPVMEVFRMLDVEHPLLHELRELESLEDFIVEINDELPGEGDEVSYDQFTFAVESVENKRIKRVRVHVHAQA